MEYRFIGGKNFNGGKWSALERWRCAFLEKEVVYKVVGVGKKDVRTMGKMGGKIGSDQKIYRKNAQDLNVFPFLLFFFIEPINFFFKVFFSFLIWSFKSPILCRTSSSKSNSNLDSFV